MKSRSSSKLDSDKRLDGNITFYNMVSFTYSQTHSYSFIFTIKSRKVFNTFFLKIWNPSIRNSMPSDFHSHISLFLFRCGLRHFHIAFPVSSCLTRKRQTCVCKFLSSTLSVIVRNIHLHHSTENERNRMRIFIILHYSIKSFRQSYNFIFLQCIPSGERERGSVEKKHF
jgi:hypothetical protein